MINKKWKVAVCCFSAAVMFSNFHVNATDFEIPLAGLGARHRQEAVEESELAVVQAEDYANIRRTAETEGEVLGRLYRNFGAHILKNEGEWSQVRSGEITGYVKTEFLLTGARAQEILKEIGTESATVRTTALMLRKEASQESAVLTIVGAYEKLGVIENGRQWVKVAVNDVEGYVAKDYIELVCQYPEAESIKVVNERLSAAKNALASAQEMLADATQAMYEIRPGDAAYDAEMAHQAAAEAKALASEQPYDQELQALAEEAAAVAEEADYAAAMAKEAAEQPETEPQTEVETEPDTETEEPTTEVQTEPETQPATAGTDQSAVPALSTGTTGIRQDVVNFALQFVGNPYVYGGTDLYNGTDCSGFTQSVMLNFGYTLPRTAGEQSINGQEISLDELQPGDLLFYSGDADYGIDHVTMYIGGGQVVHASSPSNGIMISNIDYRTPYSARRYIN